MLAVKKPGMGRAQRATNARLVGASPRAASDTQLKPPASKLAASFCTEHDGRPTHAAATTASLAGA